MPAKVTVVCIPPLFFWVPDSNWPHRMNIIPAQNTYHTFHTTTITGCPPENDPYGHIIVGF